MRLEDRLALIGAFRVLGFSVVMPFVGLALHADLGVPLTGVAAFYAALAAVGALGQLVGGYVSDLVGRVRTMVLGSSASAALLAAAAVIYRAAWVEALVLAQSLFSSAYSVASMALVGDSFETHEGLVRAYGRLRVGSNAGWALGAAVGGALYSELGFRDVLALGSAIQAAAVALVAGLGERRRPGWRLALEPPTRALAAFLAPSLLTFIIAGLMGYPLVQYLSGVRGVGTGYVGLLLALNGVLVVALQDVVARGASRLSPLVPLVAGMLIYAAGYASLPLVPDLALPAVVVVVTLGEMLVMPVSSAVAARLSSASSRGTHIGIYGLVTSVGRTLSSAIFAAALALAGPSRAWALEASLAAGAAALYAAAWPAFGGAGRACCRFRGQLP